MTKLLVLLGLSLLFSCVCAEVNVFSIKASKLGRNAPQAVQSERDRSSSIIVQEANRGVVTPAGPHVHSSKKENAQFVLTTHGSLFEFNVATEIAAGSKFLRAFGFSDAGSEPVVPDPTGPVFNFYASHTTYTTAEQFLADRIILATDKIALISPAFDVVFTPTVPGSWVYAEGSRWPQDDNIASANFGVAFQYLFVQVVTDYHGVLDIRVEDEDGSGNPTDGDPQFGGLQGQYFQFHGMADEVFSLVSSPALQMNSLFKYLASGTCDYNNTVCWTHPGTYLGQMGIQFGSNKILLQPSSHSAGMKVFLNDHELHTSLNTRRLSGSNTSALLQFENKDTFGLYTDLFVIRIVNSDYFFNLDFALKDQTILNAGSKPLQITGEICELESNMNKLATDHKSVIAKKLKDQYPAYPLHGLIGQTWRNAIYCGRYYEGSVDDYVVDSLFGNEHTFNYYHQ